MGAIIGLAIGAVVGLLLLVALFFLLLRRRRAKARRHANVLPSPVLPLQNPDTQGGYFFGGYAGSQGANPMRELYLRTSPAMPQAPDPVHAGRRSGVELLPASTFRDSSGSYADTATLVSEGGTDMSMKMVRLFMHVVCWVLTEVDCRSRPVLRDLQSSIWMYELNDHAVYYTLYSTCRPADCMNSLSSPPTHQM